MTDTKTLSKEDFTKIKDITSPEERKLQAMLYDLHSLSAALVLHNSYLKQLEEAIPLIGLIFGSGTENYYSTTLDTLSQQYEDMGKPIRLSCDRHVFYLSYIQEIAEELVQLLPLDSEF